MMFRMNAILAALLLPCAAVSQTMTADLSLNANDPCRAEVSKFEQGLLSHMRGPGKAVLDSIRKEKQLTDDIRGKLKAEIDGFAKNFA